MNRPYVGSRARRYSGPPSSSWAIPFLLMMIATALFGPLVPIVAAEGPSTDTYFTYSYHENVDNGVGNYEGWTEETKGTGTYTFLSSSQVHAHYSYDTSSSDGKKSHHAADRTATFSLATRHYTVRTIDLDDYDGTNGTQLCIWFYISTSVAVGTPVCILENDWPVTDTNAKIWSNYIPKQNLIEVTHKGVQSRDDDYGTMTYSYSDKLYFDKSSGMFVAERYDEYDSGTYQHLEASFNMHVQIDVTSSSYEFQTDWLTLIGIILTVILVVLGVCYLIYLIRWRSRTFEVRDLFAQGRSKVKVRRIRKKEQFPRLPNCATAFFEPYLVHWVDKALACKDRVAVAIDPAYGLVGVAFYSKEGKIGTILCKHTELTELLRSYIGCKDFFSEMRHAIQLTMDMSQDPYLMAQLNKFGTQAFNVFETYNVYRLGEIRPTYFDTDLVRPMRDEDVLAVSELAKKIYKCKATKWITGNLKAGDYGVVAVADGKIVGFGFACICGRSGRLHTLGVDPAYRGRGIAKELHRARLEAMRLMGVTTVVDEIADWNLASIRISTLSGFQSIGKMYVETVRKKRIKKDIVRR